MATNAGLFRAMYPEHATEPLKDCVYAAAEVLTFGYRMYEIADHADEFVPGAVAQAFVGAYPHADPQALIDLMRKAPAPPKPIFHRIVDLYERLIAEMTLCRTVDNYLTYVAALLKLVFTHRPETLKSGQKVTTKQVLNHSTIDGFVRWLADKRVYELSYQGIKELNSFFDDQLGIPLLEPEQFSEASRVIETRNLLVHNRGIINERFVARVGEECGALGEHVEVSLHAATQGAMTLWTGAVRLDERAARHFGLPTSVPWPLPDDSDSDDHARSKSEGK